MQIPNVRHIMGLLWGWILSLILTEFFKGAYRVFDGAHLKHHAWAATWTLGACALFMSKQIADLFIYFKSTEKYDPPFQSSDTLGTLLRYAGENAIEVLILFFCYGSVHQICVQNLPESFKASGFLERSAGSGLLLSMAIVEFLWFCWDCLYIYKRRRNLADVPAGRKLDPIFNFRYLHDEMVVEWVQLNGLSSFITFRWYQLYNMHGNYSYQLQGKAALGWLLIPAVLYFVVYQYLMKDYYLGDGYPLASNTIPGAVRRTSNNWIVGRLIRKLLQ